MKSFDELLLSEILSNLGNQYSDNYDFYRFGSKPQNKTTWKSKLKTYLKKRLGVDNVYLNIGKYQKSLEQLSPHLEGISNLYKNLADDDSKQLLIKLIAFKILGEEKYKLPLSTSSYWKGIEEIDQIKNINDFISVPFVGGTLIKLYKFNLKQLNIPIEIYYDSSAIYSHLRIKQYEYVSNQIIIKPEAGDIVLDCGACWGDTALFFSNEVEKEGHVYSFEFIPTNIMTFNMNVNLNPQLRDKITLIPIPLGESSDQELCYIENGPGSTLTTDRTASSSKIKTISIDDFFVKYNLKKVDFIKMDIEGAELQALKGGTNTIQKFKPKLAISIYHSMDDFTKIPEYLHSLDIGYKFYIKHGTIHLEETVLLAIANKN
jgi:FkbM family methyltransferase